LEAKATAPFCFACHMISGESCEESITTGVCGHFF
jgi:hypothetical protein